MPQVPRRKSVEGFTLTELMIVVAVIALVAALAAPGISGAIAERRTQDASIDLVRMMRSARGASAGYGRAYLVRVRPDASSGVGEVEVIRGSNNLCATAVFEDDDALGCLEADCVEIWPDPHTTGVVGSAYTIELSTATGDHNLCFQPNGIMLTQAVGGGSVFFDTNRDPASGNAGTGGLTYTIQRFDLDAAATGVARRVVIPSGGGDARILR